MLFLSLHYRSFRWRSQHLNEMENLYLERGVDKIEKNSKQGAHIHQLTAWPVLHACAQSHDSGSDRHGQLFRSALLGLISMIWSMNGGKTRVSKTI